MKTNERIKNIMNKLAISALTLLMGLTTFTVDIRANEETYSNEDLTINVERKQINNNAETELLFSVIHNDNIEINDIKLADVELEKVAGDLPNTYKYKSVVGIDGNFKFTVNYSKTLLSETDDVQKTIERKDKFDFNIEVTAPISEVENKTDSILIEESRAEPVEIEKKTEQIEVEDNKTINTESAGKGRSIFQVNGMMRAGNVSKTDIPFKYHVYKTNDPSWEYYDYQYANISYWNEHAICLDPSTMITSENYVASEDFKNLSSEIQMRLTLIGNYGYKYFGTQKHILAETTLVWKEMGWTTQSWKDMSGNTINISQEIADIENAISHHYDKPSWNGTTKNVNVGETVDLSDAKLKGYSVLSSTGVEVVQNSGTTLKIKLKDNSSKLTLVKKSNVNEGTPIIYKAPSSQDIVVSRIKDPVRINITLKANKHTITFEKQDAVNGNIKLNGAVIRVSRSNSVDANGFMNAATHWDYTTGSNGLTPTDTFGDIGKTYYYQEVKAPHGYVVDKTIHSFVAESGKTSTLTLDNIKAIGQIELLKVDYKSKEAISDAEYGLFNLSNVLVDSSTTDSNGIANFSNVEQGSYYVKETRSPLGYVLDETKYTVVIKYVDQDTPVIKVRLDVEEMREIELKTSASFTECDKEEPNIVTITDKVSYHNLVIGKEYRADGYLMDKETNQPILIDGQRIEGSTTFTAVQHDGIVDVLFTFDQNKLKTESIVVFEEMYQNNKLVAVHTDINDIEQTVEIPKMQTNASFTERDKDEPNIVTITDKVAYENLIIGKEYRVDGYLMDKETNEPILIDGQRIEGSTTFTADKRDGIVDVLFTFDQNKLKTETVVVFEDMYEDERLIAVHNDINDIEQTVEIPKMQTSASFTERDKEEPNIVTITDKVAYENLIIGKKYRVDGYLMDKETNEPILIDGQRIEGSTTFTADKRDGTVDVLFTFDQNKLSTKSIVVFEDMYEDERLIAVHNDINDIEQTVDLITVRITKLDSISKKSLKGAEFTMYDTEDMVIDVQVSDDSGIAEFTIFAGEVVRIKETNAPEGYILSDEVIEIDASKDIDGNLYSVEYFNDMLPVVVLPKAGVGMSGSLSFGGVSALLGAISLLISKLKKKKETEEHLIETVSSIKRDGDVITIVDTQEVCYFKEGIEHITADDYSVAFDYYGRAIKLVCANKELIHHLLEVLKM
ncbi:VaFE repeat-containing surface-anchored protein [Erysipelothrix rhusiopathiae]|nr:VaFE repeat-containing surface-anchored protein [Erysipelothrix rhusiopathiae]